MPDNDEIRRIPVPDGSAEKKNEAPASASPKQGRPAPVPSNTAQDLAKEDEIEEALPTERPFDLGAFIRKIPLRAWLAIVLVLLLSILAVFLLLNPDFRVQKIYVSGNKRFTTEQILQVSDIHEGDHLYAHVGGSLKERLTLKYGGVREEILKWDPYIADAQVYPKYPGEVYIEITERKKVAYIAIPDGYAIISEDSVVLEILQGDVPEGVPEIRGLPVRSAQIGKKLDLTSTEGYDICITILGAILGADATSSEDGNDFDFLSHVICVRYCDNMTTFVDLDVPGILHTISVKIGSLTTISDDMNWLRYAITSGYFDNMSGSVLDMTGKEYILR
ncbi:MAG: FtsQ-type POTRA domain-containing protein [Clostridiales bacterium]|nr:FtsQ-type POTRA domain-containing protein [Clostridiales bacterium]